MPGRPQLALFEKHVASLGGDDVVFEHIAEGHSMKAVAELVGASSRGMLYLWIDNKKGERKPKLTAARKISAHSTAEDAGQILDDLADELVVTGPDVQLATSRSKYRTWLAGMRNREEYGDQAGVTVNLSVGDLHLGALQRHSAAAIAARADDVLLIEEASYEVEDEEGKKE